MADESLKQLITADLTTSMKTKDAARTSTLRMVKAAFMNREIEKRSDLTDEEMLGLLRSLVKQRRDSIEQFEKAGRLELVARETAEIETIQAYLPQSATAEEMERAVIAAISESGASSIRDMGKVMKVVQGRLQGRNADNKTISEIVKAKLG